MNKVLALPEKERQLQDLVDSFEEAWNDQVPEINSFVSRVPESIHLDALTELVRVDMERRSSSGNTKSLDEYLNDFPLLKSNASIVESLRETFNALQESTNRELSDFRSTLHSSKFVATPGGKAPAQLQDDKSDKLGQYEIIKILGKGGFGKVYLATDPVLGHKVAIKVKDSDADTKGLPADFLQEARSVLRLDHPSIVRLLHAGETGDGRGFIVYEFVDGETLETYINGSNYSIETCVEWIAEIAEALDHAHKEHVVHRDVSTRNIMINRKGQAKLLDFGLSRLDGRAFQNDRGVVLGSVYYMSPEQASANSSWATPQSDIFSLGSVLYHLMTRRRAFDGNPEDNTRNQMEDIRNQIIKATPAPPRSIAAGINNRLEDCCLQALEKDPKKRFRTGQDFAVALRRSIAPIQPHRFHHYYAFSVGIVLIACLAFVALHFASKLEQVPLPKPPPRGPGPGQETVETAPLRLQSARLMVVDNSGNHPISDRDLPLGPENNVSIEWTTTEPAFGCVLMFDHEGKGQVVYQAIKDKPSDQCVKQMTNTSGLAFFVVGISDHPISESDLNELLTTSPFAEKVEFADAINYAGRFNVFDETRGRPEKYDESPATKSDGSTIKNLVVTDVFKGKMSARFNHFYGQMFGVKLPNRR